MKIVIVGGGLSGLMLAEKLSGSHDITIIEKEKYLGGLARSIHYENSIFDVGPHFFTAKDDEVLDLFNSINRGSGLISGCKKTNLDINGRNVKWPPTIMQMIGMDALGVAGAAARLFGSLFVKREFESLEDYFVKTYGRRLHELMFDPLFSLFMKHNPSDIDYLLAEKSLSIATKQEGINFLDMLLTIITKKKINFLYNENGSGEFIDNISKIIKKSRRVKIMTGADIVSIKNDEIILKGKKSPLKFDRILWTAPITTLCDMMKINPKRLGYLNLVLYNIELSKCDDSDNHYSYIIRKGIPFHRITFLHRISPLLSKNKLVTLERTTMEGSVSDLSSNEKREVEKSLVSLGVITSPGDIISIHKEFITHAYPIFYRNFTEDLEQIRTKIKDKNKNIILFGRTGNYSYLNMDDILGETIRFGKSL